MPLHSGGEGVLLALFFPSEDAWTKERPESTQIALT